MKLIKDLGMRKAKETSKQNKRFGVYRCPSCWEEVVAQTYDVNNGKIKQCFNCRKTNAGLSKTKIHERWRSIVRRCCDISNISYKYYGARGITVCDEWKNSFLSFYNWAINNGYREGLQIDRLDNSKGYCPDNCRWVTVFVNSINRRSTKLNGNIVIEIFKRAKMGNESHENIAKDYNIARTMVTRIKNGSRWSDITSSIALT